MWKRNTKVIEQKIDRINRIFLAYSNEEIPFGALKIDSNQLDKEEPRIRDYARIYGWIKAIDESAMSHFYPNGLFFDKVKADLVNIGSGDYSIKLANRILDRGGEVVEARVAKNRISDLFETFESNNYKDKIEEIIERWRTERFDRLSMVVAYFNDVLLHERVRLFRETNEKPAKVDIEVFDFLTDRLTKYLEDVQGKKQKRIKEAEEANKDRRYGRINFDEKQIARFQKIRSRYLRDFQLSKEEMLGELDDNLLIEHPHLPDEFVDHHNRFGRIFYMVSNGIYLRVEASPFAEKYLNCPLAQIILAIYPQNEDVVRLLSAVSDPSFEHSDGALATARMHISKTSMIEEMQSDVPDLVRFKKLRGTKKNNYGKIIYQWQNIVRDVAEEYARSLGALELYGATPYQMYCRYGTIMHPKKADVYFEKLGEDAQLKSNGRGFYFCRKLDPTMEKDVQELLVDEIVESIRASIFENSEINSRKLAESLSAKLDGREYSKKDIGNVVSQLFKNKELRKKQGTILSALVVACSDRIKYFDFSDLKEIDEFVIESNKSLDIVIRGNFSYLKISNPGNFKIFGKLSGRNYVILEVVSAEIHLEGKQLNIATDLGDIKIYGDKKFIKIRNFNQGEVRHYSIFENPPRITYYGNADALEYDIPVGVWGRIGKIINK